MRLRRAPLLNGIAALAAFLLSISACSLRAVLPGDFAAPTVTLNASLVESLSSSTTVVRFILAVENPNAFGLPARATACQLRIGGHELATGSSAGSVIVPAHAASQLEVRMAVPFAKLSAAAPDAVLLGEVPYDLDGTLRVGSFLSSREVRFTVSSVLRLNLLEVGGLLPLPSSPEAGKATLTGQKLLAQRRGDTENSSSRPSTKEPTSHGFQSCRDQRSHRRNRTGA